MYSNNNAVRPFCRNVLISAWSNAAAASSPLSLPPAAPLSVTNKTTLSSSSISQEFLFAFLPLIIRSGVEVVQSHQLFQHERFAVFGGGHTSERDFGVDFFVRRRRGALVVVFGRG